tara:strand:+ start:1387 stop:1698 length:312 start_codon:yes stop_codon:yes gene_type:complete
MNNVFSSKSFMARFSAPMSTGPAKATKEVTETFDKNGDGTPFQKEDLAMLRKQAPAKTVEELEQKKKDMQLGKHRVKPGGDSKNVKKFNKKIRRINKRIDNKS